MSACSQAREWVLLGGFLAAIGLVPLAQTVLELGRRERVQAAEVFRERPTAARLREYERTLEEKSWFQQRCRPLVRAFLFRTLRDTGAKAVMGRDQWLFYRPDLRVLVEPDRPEADRGEGKWVAPADGRTRSDHVLRAIVRFRDQLAERGIRLVVVPTPGKPSVYPDRVTSRDLGPPGSFRSPTEGLVMRLREQGVETVDLFALFRSERQRRSPAAAPLYLARDTHWTPEGASLAAAAVAQRLRQRAWAPPESVAFLTAPVRVQRWGDLLEMLQIPGLHARFPTETVDCLQVKDPALGLLCPTPSDRPGTYRYPGQKATVLVLGDSFSRIYQLAEPRSLGDAGPGPGDGAAALSEGATRRLLPGSAGFVSHLARALGSPVDAIVSDGGASTDVRQKLSTNPEILEGKRVVVWQFVERDVALGKTGWLEVPLPPKLGI